MTDNNHKFFDRFNTGDGTPHGDFIVSRFDYAKKPRNKILTDEYTERLQHIPLTELAAVWSDLQNPDYALAIVPSIEAVIARHKLRKKLQTERRESIKEQKAKPVSHGEKHYAKQACNGAYANRIMNHLGVEVPLQTQKYSGGFDFKSVANKAPLPLAEPVKHIDDHKPFWESMWEEFEQAWGDYAS